MKKSTRSRILGTQGFSHFEFLLLVMVAGILCAAFYPYFFSLRGKGYGFLEAATLSGLFATGALLAVFLVFFVLVPSIWKLITRKEVHHASFGFFAIILCSAGVFLYALFSSSLPLFTLTVLTLLIIIGGYVIRQRTKVSLLVWDLASGEPISKLRGGRSVDAVAFSPDGKILASAGEDKMVRLWDTVTGKVIHKLKGHGDAVYSIAFSPSGKLLAALCGGGKAMLWDVEDRKVVHTFKRVGGTVAFSPDGKTIATGGYGETIKLWDVASGKETRVLKGHEASIKCLVFSPDGKILASIDHKNFNNAIRLWKVATGEMIHKLKQKLKGHKGQIYSISFSPDGGTLASGGYDKTVKLWSVKYRKVIRTLKGDKCCEAVSFSPDGKLLASCTGYKEVITLWKVTSGKKDQVLHWRHSAQSVAFSPDGKILASGLFVG